MSNTSTVGNLLIEIGTEELPAKNLKTLKNNFVEMLSKALHNKSLSFETIEGFVTPRRLAARINNLTLKQPNRTLVKRGPAKTAAFDKEGKPTKAALGFAESVGVAFDTIKFQETDKGSWLVFEQIEAGQLAEQLIPNIVEEVLNQVPLPRRMRWGSTEYSFIRPIHWIVLLLDNKPIHAHLFGINSGNSTLGHRFHHPNPILLSNPKEYEDILSNTGFVIADFEKRREKIRKDLLKLAEEHNAHPIIEEELLEEVTGLVEWPVVLWGNFDSEFLKIPKEALISSMQVHQKCFPVVDKENNLLPHFLIVSNLQSKEPNAVSTGNESVMLARLADAAFYYNVDRDIPLSQRRSQLQQVVFQAGLGTLWDKSERIAQLSQEIARDIGADPIFTERAALLCKADLLTQMVGEFPELQGIMGHYYALHDGEPPQVASAIEEHYHPRFANDTLPVSLEGSALAIADRIDSLVGLFSLGKTPTGDKDPFALRRQALGILRIIIEKKMDLELRKLLEKSFSLYKSPLLGGELDLKIQEIQVFFMQRLSAWYQEHGIPPRILAATCQTSYLDNVFDFHVRLNTLNEFIKDYPIEAESLGAANKRVQNILIKNQAYHTDQEGKIDSNLFENPAEKKLADLLIIKEKEISPLLKKKDYKEALIVLASLKDPIDQFFDHVMVIVEDESIRKNRLKLLLRFYNLFKKIADFSSL